jgi:hypothetical protein
LRVRALKQAVLLWCEAKRGALLEERVDALEERPVEGDAVISG